MPTRFAVKIGQLQVYFLSLMAVEEITSPGRQSVLHKTDSFTVDIYIYIYKVHRFSRVLACRSRQEQQIRRQELEEEEERRRHLREGKLRKYITERSDVTPRRGESATKRLRQHKYA